MLTNSSRLLAAALLCASLTAQCFETDFGVLCPRTGFPAGVGDDVLFDVQPLGFSFPMGGVSSNYSHAHIQSNGVVFLTTGAASGETATGFSNTASTQINNLRGGPGNWPRIAPFWRDLDMLPGNGGGVWFNDSIAGKFVITWANAVQFGTSSPVFTIQAQLQDDGDVTFYYGPSTTSAAPVISGVSQGDGVAAVAGVDLSAGGNTSTALLLFERFAAGAFDLDGDCVQCTFNGSGYSQQAGPPAGHDSYGAGCYEYATETFYQAFAQASQASAALTGQSMVMTPVANGYDVTWGGVSFVAPSGAADVLAVGDDGEVGRALGSVMPTPFGAASDLRVHGNAIISLGAAPQAFPGAPNAYTPTITALRDAPLTAFWSWHDYNAAESGSGNVTYDEQVVSGQPVALITWLNVESYSTPLAVNRSTLQFQLNLLTGVVAIVWVDIDDNNTSQYGSGHLVGYSIGGPSGDPGPIDLSTQLPITVQPDSGALALSASPSPVSTATTGTLVTYTTTDIPIALSGSGVYVAANILSLIGVPAPGVELGSIGAPGCRAHVFTIDVIQAMIGATSTLTASFQVPPGVPAGFEIFSQSIALVVPFSLPNGQNAFGLTTSNGVRSVIRPF